MKYSFIICFLIGSCQAAEKRDIPLPIALFPENTRYVDTPGYGHKRIAPQQKSFVPDPKKAMNDLVQLKPPGRTPNKGDCGKFKKRHSKEKQEQQLRAKKIDRLTRLLEDEVVKTSNDFMLDPDNPQLKEKRITAALKYVQQWNSLEKHLKKGSK